jgi:nitrogen-specific signal transduction histidine kinase
VNAQIHSYQPKLDSMTLSGLDHLDNLNATNTKGEAALTLSENGMILHCNEVAENFLACAPSVLVWRPISRLFPQLAGMSLILGDEVNPNLNFYHCLAITLKG